MENAWTAVEENSRLELAGPCFKQDETHPSEQAATAIRAWPLIIAVVKTADIVAPESNFPTSLLFPLCLAAASKVQARIHQVPIALNAPLVSDHECDSTTRRPSLFTHKSVEIPTLCYPFSSVDECFGYMWLLREWYYQCGQVMAYCACPANWCRCLATIKGFYVRIQFHLLLGWLKTTYSCSTQ